MERLRHYPYTTPIYLTLFICWTHALWSTLFNVSLPNDQQIIKIVIISLYLVWYLFFIVYEFLVAYYWHTAYYWQTHASFSYTHRRCDPCQYAQMHIVYLWISYENFNCFDWMKKCSCEFVIKLNGLRTFRHTQRHTHIVYLSYGQRICTIMMERLHRTPL